MTHILKHLEEIDLCSFRSVCKQLYIRITNDQLLWKQLYQSKFNDLAPSEKLTQNYYLLFKTRLLLLLISSPTEQLGQSILTALWKAVTLGL
jgi:hypothetical protein